MNAERRGTRRQFLAAALALPSAGCVSRAGPILLGLTRKSERPIAGSFVNESLTEGHKLRDRTPFSPPRQTVRVPIVIVGGGMAGLSAAWFLEKCGFHDFLLLEMAGQAGGNSRWGENEITGYPWGAHYVPVPGPDSALVRELFAEMGVLQDGRWDERYLCFSPRNACFCTAAGKRISSPPSGSPRGTATSSSA